MFISINIYVSHLLGLNKLDFILNRIIKEKNNRNTTLEKDIVLSGTEEPHTSRYASKQRQLKH